jgi:hypothetical protein
MMGSKVGLSLDRLPQSFALLRVLGGFCLHLSGKVAVRFS